MKQTTLSLLSAAALLSISGCAGYQLGPIKPDVMADVNTLAVPTFVNQTLEPRIAVLVTNTVIKELQLDGTYEIASTNSADAVVEGEIREIRRRRARSVRDNVLATREFEIRLFIDFTVTERATGRQLMKRTVSGDTSFFVGEDVQQDERQAIPLAAEDAAVRMASILSEGG